MRKKKREKRKRKKKIRKTRESEKKNTFSPPESRDSSIRRDVRED